MTPHRLFAAISLSVLCGSSALAQVTQAAPPSTAVHTQKFVRGDAQFRGPGGSGDPGPGPRTELRIGPPGMWWKNPELVQKLTLTADQQKRMDDIFQQTRLQLIDLKANVEKQEVLLEPMLSANPPDTNKVLAQIDHVASARAELEKANARMLLSIRGVLSADQWTKLQAEQRDNRRFMFRYKPGPGGPEGPEGPRPPGGPSSSNSFYRVFPGRPEPVQVFQAGPGSQFGPVLTPAMPMTVAIAAEPIDADDDLQVTAYDLDM